jgi:WS/DGAT/MGAT family acyltransferase
MAQQHLDRLTVMDSSFLLQEDADSHMHIGALIICDGPVPTFGELLDSIRERLHLVPRYRQKLRVPRFDAGRPLWVDDPNFNIEYHVRQTALPAPGSEEQLLRLTARLFSQQLDRAKPLWEMWMIEGLEDGRFAIIQKTHHSLVDGISGVDMGTVLFDLSPEATEIPHPADAWIPHQEPSTAEVATAAASDSIRGAVRLANRLLAATTRPEAAMREVRSASEGVGEFVWALMNPAPDTPLNVQHGPHRRYREVRNQLDDFRLVKNTFGGTVNDVVLTVVSGALRDWLRLRGTRTEGLELRALVPVSVRTPDQHGALGNQIVAMRGPLPVYIEDPLVRLQTVRKAMNGLKESKQALGVEVLMNSQGFAPPTILAQASRLNFSTTLFNLIVTNVPGPQFPLYVRGRMMRDVFPIAFLPQKHALSIGIMSYNGQVNFGLLGDYDALPDLDRIADGIADSLAELVRLAKREQARLEKKQQLKNAS